MALSWWLRFFIWDGDRHRPITPGRSTRNDNAYRKLVRVGIQVLFEARGVCDRAVGIVHEDEQRVGIGMGAEVLDIDGELLAELLDAQTLTHHLGFDGNALTPQQEVEPRRCSRHL